MAQSIAIVTGASSGIGRAIAAHLARSVKVLAVARRADALQETCRIGAADTIHTVAADITTRQGKNAIVEAVRASGAKVKFLVQNAGTIGPIAPAAGEIGTSTEEAQENDFEDAWCKTFELNVHAQLFLVRALNRAGLFENEGARVLHIGSGAAHNAVAGWGAYCASKSAFLMLARCMQTEATASNQGVKLAVSSVQPGIVESPMQEVIRAASDSSMPDVSFFRSLKENEYKEGHSVGDVACQSGSLPPLPPPHCPPTDGLDTADNAAHFCNFLLNEMSQEEFVSKEWDIRDSSHWKRWVKTTN